MLRGALFLLAFVLIVLLVITVVSAILLALGTGLALLFPVTAFQATIVVTVVSAMVFALWLLSGMVHEEHGEVEESEAERAADILLHAMPLGRPRGGKRRRR